MIIPSNHPLFKFESQVNQLCKPLFKNFNIQEFAYLKIFKDGHFVHLETMPSFANDYYALNLYPSLFELTHNARHYVVLSPLLDHPYISYHQDKLKSNIHLGINHQLNHRLYIIKNKPEFFEIYGFGTTETNPNMIDYLFMNIEMFNKFALYFKNRAYSLIEESYGSKTKLVDFTTPPINNNLQCEHKENPYISDEISLKNYMISDTKISAREIQCLNYLAHGLNTKEIAKSLELAPKTVEFYIYNLKNKLNCSHKSELVKIYYESDLSDMQTMF